jgi:hypothetical protein
MGFLFLGMIAEACKEEFKTNMNDVVKMAASGLQSKNLRVKWEALKAVGMLVNELSPTIQYKYTH